MAATAVDLLQAAMITGRFLRARPPAQGGNRKPASRMSRACAFLNQPATLVKLSVYRDELNQPLGAIINNAETGSSHPFKSRNQTGRDQDNSDEIRRETIGRTEVIRRLRRCLKRLRFDAGRLTNETVREVLKFFRCRPPERNVTLKM